MNAAQTHAGASAAAIQHHYDAGNDFYAQWLDANMVYSGALWADGDDLEAAQLRKIDFHVAEAAAAGKKRVLVVGCGWGALLRRLVTHHGVERAVGLTLSRAQLEWCHARPIEGVEARLESWSDHPGEARYDAIVSIGAFEHFARLSFSEEEKVSAYRAFFRRCQGWLSPGGLLSLQTFAYGSARSREAARGASSTQFLASEIFRETDPPRLANIADAIEGSFELVRLRNDRLDYARTCKAWLDNIARNREAIVAKAGEEATARYERYLQYSFIGFHTAKLDLHRLTLRSLR